MAGPKVSNLKLAIQGGTTNTLYATWSWNASSSGGSAPTTSTRAKQGDRVTIKSGSKYYNGVRIPSWVMRKTWIVSQVKGTRAVINKSTDGQNAINSPIHVDNLVVVGSSQSAPSTVNKNTLDKYKVKWQYSTNQGVWFSGSSSDTKETHATYSIPDNAITVKCIVTPVAKTYDSESKSGTTQVPYWTGVAVSATFSASEAPPEKPSAPSVVLDKYKLTASLENIDDAKTEQIEFEVYKDNTRVCGSTVPVITARASYTCNILAGSKYRVRCRAVNFISSGKTYSEWSPYSGEALSIPATPTNVAAVVESGEDGGVNVRITWTGTATSESYTIEYTTNKKYFDTSSEVSSTSVTGTTAYIVGLEKGKEWFFRVKATNSQGDSGWSDIVFKVIGTKPEPPTTWSLTSTVIIGEPVMLYWVHNSEDGSRQTEAQLELVINEQGSIITIEPENKEDELDTIYSYLLDMSDYPEGAEILWRMRTRGITMEYSDWSVQREINVYAPPVAELHIGDDTGILTQFPYTISVNTGPSTQTALTYHISIVAESTYETTDETGSTVTVNAGSEVFSKIFTVMGNAFSYDLNPEDVTFENSQFYHITVTASMNSGLIAEASNSFMVSWAEVDYAPNASVAIDLSTLTAQITPFCLDENGERVPDVTLAVFRRESDGSFTEIDSNIQNDGVLTIIDPHPSLDFARYRIVARNTMTSVNSYVDLPGIPVKEPSVVIQWDEQWSQFDYIPDAPPVSPPWTGSMIRIPYNVDSNEDYEVESSFIKYIGREHPVSYYGTQKGVKLNLSASIQKDNSEMLYALRRLAAWPGDVYVREPNGNGYKANVKVSWSIKHRDLTIPVSFNVTRVEDDD